MASQKEYAYSIKGNKLSIFERDYSGVQNGQTLSAPNIELPQGYGTWKSPQSDVTDGIEIEYSYSPEYTYNTSSAIQKNKFYINGWTVIEGDLTFVRSHLDGSAMWDTAPYSNVGDNEYINISGSSRWNGIHKVQAGGDNGLLRTYTKVNESLPLVSGINNIDIHAELADNTAQIRANDSSDIWLNQMYSVGDYIFIVNSATAHNNGMWEVSKVRTTNTAESTSGIYITNKYYSHHTSPSGSTMSTEGIDTTVDTTADTDASILLYKVYRDFCYLESDIKILSDESSTLDLPSYLSKALIYYIKAKLAEDKMELESKEYFMREFRKMVEKHESSKVAGPRGVMTGPHSIR
tara:strand:+ start:1059 stop:2108 length:1050 start_codon:yes stop_codon:yes gene_type:complete